MTEKSLPKFKGAVKRWFTRTEYVQPDFTWHRDIKGLFCWSETRQVGFIFRPDGRIMRDRLLMLRIPHAEKL